MFQILAGGKHHRFKRGYKNVIDEAIRLVILKNANTCLEYFQMNSYSRADSVFLQNAVGEESHLAIETSGHGALKENNWLDDGAYLMVGTGCLYLFIFIVSS